MFQEGQQPELDRAIFVGQSDGRDIAVIDRGQMDALSFHEPAAESQTFGGVVVAADDEYLLLLFGQAAEKIIEQSHCLGRGNTFVIDITGDQYSPGLFGIDCLQDLLQDVCLLFDHGNLIDPLVKCCY